MAATATRPASVSLGLCNSTRITRLRSVSTSTTAALAPRRRGAASPLADFLGTFLHQSRLIPKVVVRFVVKFLAQHRRQGRDLGFSRFGLRRRVDERQFDGHGRALADPALYRHFTEMQRHEALHDRKAKPGSFMTALIGLAALKERRTD